MSASQYRPSYEQCPTCSNIEAFYKAERRLKYAEEQAKIDEEKRNQTIRQKAVVDTGWVYEI